ncbi:MAG: hypothetical protein HY820_33895 [Acidobacteria bacterium]|nr:hypothetical protein [Acidobacteriota bacterium]
MMKTLLLAVAAAALISAQDPPKPEEKKAEEKTAEAAAEPAAVGPFRADLELGVRVNGDIRGNFDAYRSMVNLGEGLRLMNWDIGYHSDTNKAIKKGQFRGSGWGGDPSAWMSFNVENSAYYRLRVDHRSTAYFNSLPSYANPLIDRGIFASQRAFDTTRRMTDIQLDILPTNWIIPYFGYSRDRGFGRGVSAFVSDANEYPVATDLTDHTNLARGGVRIERRRYHATLEQGGLLFRDGQSLFQTAGRNLGNITRPILGQTLFLSNLLQSYDVEGSSLFTRGLLTGQPANWLDVSASFQYSKPRSDVSYRHTNDGRFVDLDSLAFFNSQNFLALSSANQPHITAGAGAELRPMSRFRVIGSWLTDRLHNGSGAIGNLSSGSSVSALADRLVWNYNQEQVEAVYEVTRRIVVRGGQRYVWGESLGRSGQLGQNPQERGELRRKSAIGGVGYRATDRASFNADVEIARADKVLYRTSMSDFERLRMRGRYYFSDAFHLYGTFQYTNNSAPASLVPFEFRSMQTAAGVQWLPKGGKTFEVMGEYARSTIRSDLNYLDPDLFLSRRSLYRDNAHTLTGLLTWRMAVGWTFHPTLTAGGSMFLSSGTRPTSYYQPVTRLTTPVTSRLDFFGEYRWYGVTQSFYLYEGFRSHQGTIGVRIH